MRFSGFDVPRESNRWRRGHEGNHFEVRGRGDDGIGLRICAHALGGVGEQGNGEGSENRLDGEPRSLKGSDDVVGDETVIRMSWGSRESNRRHFSQQDRTSNESETPH
jgi:hypothetical protein